MRERQRGTTLSEAEIQRLCSDPRALVRALKSARRNGKPEQLAGLALTFGSMFQESGDSATALRLYNFYLTKWGRRADEVTGEILSNAANASADLGDTAAAERLLDRLVRLSSRQKWHSLHRRALQSLGVMRHQQGRADDRDSFYRRALDVSIASGDRLGEAQLYNNLGAAALDAGEDREAERLIRKSIAIKREIGSEADAAGSMAMLGGVLAQSGEIAEAEKTLKEAIRVARRYRDARSMALAYHNLGTLSSDSGRLKDAIRLMKVGLSYADRSNYLVGQKLGNQGLAVNYHRLGRPRAAADHFRRLIDLAGRLGDPHAVALAHHDLGSMLALDGNRDAAQAEYAKAAKEFSTLGDVQWHAITLLSLAKIATDPAHASNLLRELLRLVLPKRPVGFPAAEVSNLAVRLGDEGLVRDALPLERASRDETSPASWAGRLVMLGAMASHYGHWPLAEQLYTESLRLHKLSRAPEMVGRIQNDLGIALIEQGEIEKALKTLQDALTFGRKEQNRAIVAQASHNIGEGYRRLGDNRRAMKYLRESLDAATAIGDVDGQAGTLHSLGLAYLRSGKRESAERAFRDLQSIGRRIHNDFHAAQAMMGLAKVEYDRGEIRDSLAKYTRAAQLFEKAGRRSEQTNAIYEMGLASAKLGRQQRAAALLMKSATMASDAADWSMLSIALQGLSYVTADHGTARQTAELLVSALWAAIASHNRARNYHSVLDSYSDVLDKLAKRRKATPKMFLRLVMHKVAKQPKPEITQLVRRDLEEITARHAGRHNGAR